MTALILIGPDGAGKTTLLAGLEDCGYTVADVDTIVAQQLGVSEETVFTEVDSLHRHAVASDLVRDLCADIINEPETDFALTLPADFFANETLAALVKDVQRQTSVYILSLECSVGQLIKRLGLFGPRATHIVLPRKELRLRLEERIPYYRQYADWTIDTSSYTLAEMVTEVPKRVIMLINSASSPS